MSSFVVKTKVFSGVDAFHNLKNFDIKHACIITDPFVISSGMSKLLTDVLDEMGANIASSAISYLTRPLR